MHSDRPAVLTFFQTYCRVLEDVFIVEAGHRTLFRQIVSTHFTKMIEERLTSFVARLSSYVCRRSLFILKNSVPRLHKCRTNKDAKDFLLKPRSSENEQIKTARGLVCLLLDGLTVEGLYKTWDMETYVRFWSVSKEVCMKRYKIPQGGSLQTLQQHLVDNKDNMLKELRPYRRTPWWEAPNESSITDIYCALVTTLETIATHHNLSALSFLWSGNVKKKSCEFSPEMQMVSQRVRNALVRRGYPELEAATRCDQMCKCLYLCGE